MRFCDDYEIDQYWEDNDHQDGAYFREYEKKHQEECAFRSDTEQALEERKYCAALYIRAHFKELMKDEAYNKAYRELIDEFARKFSYTVYNKPLPVVTDGLRELEGSKLDFAISIEGRRKIETYKADAVYIVDWIRSIST